MTVAYPGLPGSETMEAARAVAEGGQLVPEPTAERALEALAAGEVARAVLPVESTHDPGALANLDFLHRFRELRVVAEWWSGASRQGYTRFLVLASAEVPVEGADLTTLLLVPNRAVPNALFRSLTAFVGRRLAVRKVEARPREDEAGAYRYYVDVEGAAESEDFRAALADIDALNESVRVLGSYRAAVPTA